MLSYRKKERDAMNVLKKILGFLKKVLSKIEYNSPVTLTFS
jgi:hypothetical protein